jgi:hypothetical protein
LTDEDIRIFAYFHEIDRLRNQYQLPATFYCFSFWPNDMILLTVIICSHTK